ncbi:sugar ABC transporter permease [Blautia glucerasea]|jgi:raffinose/stachyose/melibiose transport system permease protein|uniref:carbohydrate ABC transporter permease n=1 Tax=Blautia glucerasea TaxID=536633 RepID=UPI001D02361A|nr:sugar ABC transporter permease [Blautia glucerasea]MCB5385440.1 sugar ABC transporter permease [Blautia glucerasea]MCB5420119.1 sugar ABC transporter permease [Blautia luti]
MNTKNKKIWIFLFTIPCMILFALVYAAPIITVFYTSLCDYTAFNSPAFQGIKNFITIFSDSDFICSIRNTLLWVVLQSTIHVGVGLAMALVLRRKPKGWKFARTAYMIPNIIPTAATGVMFTLLLNPMFGIVKPIMDFLGIDYAMVPNLFGNSRYAFWTVTATWIFYSGFNTIIFLAEMGAVSKEIYEAAAIDGATPWQADRYITLPLMRNVCGTCVTLASVAMVSQFDIIYMTTKGGPGTSTLNLPIYLYKAATLENNYGKANAVGVVQIIIGITLVILIKGLFREKKEAA